MLSNLSSSRNKIVFHPNRVIMLTGSFFTKEHPNFTMQNLFCYLDIHNLVELNLNFKEY